MLHFSLLAISLPAQTRDIRTQATYGSDSEAPRTKWEYYHDMWSERDVKHGRYSEWMANDKLVMQGFYFDDLKDSLWQYWYANGNPKETSWWNEGKREGKTSYFDKKGRLLQECTYKQGVPEGLAIDYYTNARVRQVAQFHTGRFHGNVTTYNRKGIRRHILQYTDGKRAPMEKESKPPKQEPVPKEAAERPAKPTETSKEKQINDTKAPKKEPTPKAIKPDRKESQQ